MLKKYQNLNTFIPMGEKAPPELFQNQIVCEWLSSAQAAQYLGISENALRIMVCRRKVKYQKLGSRLRFNVKDLESLFNPRGV